MKSGYLRNGKPYDDAHTRKSWSYWFMEMAQRRKEDEQLAKELRLLVAKFNKDRLANRSWLDKALDRVWRKVNNAIDGKTA